MSSFRLKSRQSSKLNLAQCFLNQETVWKSIYHKILAHIICNVLRIDHYGEFTTQMPASCEYYGLYICIYIYIHSPFVLHSIACPQITIIIEVNISKMKHKFQLLGQYQSTIRRNFQRVFELLMSRGNVARGSQSISRFAAYWN